MSRYYFHIREGQAFVRDEEGTECRDMNAVLNEAQASARDIAQAALKSQYEQALASIEIEDEDGRTLGHVSAALTLH